MTNFENSKSKEVKPQSVSAKQVDKAQLISRLNEIYPHFYADALIDKNGNLIKHERDDRDKLIAKLADNFGENKLNDAELLAQVGYSANLIRFEEPEFNKSIDAAETLFKEMGGKMFPKINPNNCNFDTVINFVEFTDSVIRKSSGFLIQTDKEELNEMDNLRRNGNNELLLDKLKSLTQTITNHAYAKFEGVNLPEEGFEASAESKNEYKKIMPQMMEHLYKISLFRDKIEKQVELDNEQKKIENVRQKIENSGKKGSETKAGTWKYEPAPKGKTESQKALIIDVESLIPNIQKRVDALGKQAELEKDSAKGSALIKKFNESGESLRFLEDNLKIFKGISAFEYIDAAIRSAEENLNKAFEKGSKAETSFYDGQLRKLKRAKDLIGLESGRPKNEKEKQAEKPKPEEDPELGEPALRDKNYNPLKDEPFKALYAGKTLAEVKGALTPEVKRLSLEVMLQEVDRGIGGAEQFLKKNPDISVVDRKSVGLFIGNSGATLAQRIAIAEEGRHIELGEIMAMPMVDYLKRYLGYDLRADKKRAELLKKFTNALS